MPYAPNSTLPWNLGRLGDAQVTNVFLFPETNFTAHKPCIQENRQHWFNLATWHLHNWFLECHEGWPFCRCQFCILSQCVHLYEPMTTSQCLITLKTYTIALMDLWHQTPHFKWYQFSGVNSLQAELVSYLNGRYCFGSRAIFNLLSLPVSL